MHCSFVIAEIGSWRDRSSPQPRNGLEVQSYHHMPFNKEGFILLKSILMGTT